VSDPYLLGGSELLAAVPPLSLVQEMRELSHSPFPSDLASVSKLLA
jgi:hypothetical protein